jgi:hypothetical protein
MLANAESQEPEQEDNETLQEDPEIQSANPSTSILSCPEEECSATFFMLETFVDILKKENIKTSLKITLQDYALKKVYLYIEELDQRRTFPAVIEEVQLQLKLVS